MSGNLAGAFPDMQPEANARVITSVTTARNLTLSIFGLLGNPVINGHFAKEISGFFSAPDQSNIWSE
jgi:hypothetical protein